MVEGLKNVQVKLSISTYARMLIPPSWDVIREKILVARNEERNNQAMGLPSYMSPPIGLQKPTDVGSYASKYLWTGTAGKKVTCYNYQGKGLMASECVEPKKAQ